MTDHRQHPEAPGTDPISLFQSWYSEALEVEPKTADAFALATVDAGGNPSVRVVLYKGLADGRKLRFVTNLESRKGRELSRNPRAALVFFWPTLMRQVRMEGRVDRASDDESDEYFASRDRASQLGAWASSQSRPLASRAELEQAFEAARVRFEGRAVERPPHWGMLYFVPDQVELWLSGAHRLHDRFLYRRTNEGWSSERLAP
jgi:pyridoxamine 5'-phosphate oxidase